MSRMGQYRLELQEMPEYQRGWDARLQGISRGDLLASTRGRVRSALSLGWQDCDEDLQPRMEI